MKNIIFLTFILVFFTKSLYAGEEFTKGNDDWLDNNYFVERISVLTEDWKPYNYQEDGVIKGTSTRIVKSVLDGAGFRYSIRLYPWSRSYHMALNRKNVLIYTIVRTPEREELFKWIGPVSHSEKAYLYKLSSRKDIVVKRLDDIKKYRVGVVQDSMNHLFLLSRGFDETNIDSVTTSQVYNVKKLIKGRIDLWIAGEKQFFYAVSEAGGSPDEFEKLIFLFKLFPYMAFSKQTSSRVVDKVVKSYDQLVLDGKVERFE